MIQQLRLGIAFIAFFVCYLFFLAAVPAISMGQSSFDTNGDGYIDDEELVVIINYWKQHKPIPIHDPHDSTMTVMLPGNVPLELLLIPSGEGIVNEKKTFVSKFWIGQFEITQAQWEALMGNNPSYFKDLNKPVERVSWNDCQVFLDKLNALGLGNFSLPSEAQWEYACRAGTETLFFWGDSSSQAEIYSWYNSDSGFVTHAVGTRMPNPWGLCDMTGNVWEWCEDLSSNTSAYRVLRGGSWFDEKYDLRSGFRIGDALEKGSKFIGFRVVRTP